MPAVGALAWCAALAAHACGWLAALVPAAVAVVAGVRLAGGVRAGSARAGSSLGSVQATVFAWAAVGAAVATVTVLRAGAVRDSPVARLSGEHATARITLVLTGDPRTVHGRYGRRTLFPARTETVVARGREIDCRAPVIVFGPVGPPTRDRWLRLRYGDRVDVSGRLAPDDRGETAGLLVARGPPRVRSEPAWPWRLTEHLRAGIRAGVAGHSAIARGLVPALVDGDDTALPDDVKADFRTAGLTHLLAVSGTNLTIVAGFLVLLARWCGVRARGLALVGGFAVVGFVMLARSEPSVLRAAVMGAVGLLALGNGGARRAPRALGACVLVLMLVQPTLAWAPGFALSVLATAGIVFLAPGWSRALRSWLPAWSGWLAEPVAVPLAAQVACTPVVAALSGQVSLVAVLANLLTGPVVATATVSGLLGGGIATLSTPLAHVLTLPAAWSADWIVLVARRTASLPVPALGVPTTTLGLGALSLATMLAVPALGWIAPRRIAALTVAGALVLVVAVRPPALGWPPRGWVLVMCDVGQGDGLVLRAAPGQAVVVDTGPDPAAMDRCLRRLHVDRIPVVVLTHFHADHIGGLVGVLHGRQVGQIVVSPYPDPPYGAAAVHREADRARVPVVPAAAGTVIRLGDLSWVVLAPTEAAPPGSDSPPNDDSVVLYVRSRGVSLLLMGDEETGSQEHLRALYPGLRVDVLKVAHHGSAKQDPALIRDLHARAALISVGKDNDYGHPAPSLVRLLDRTVPVVRRTDLDGSLAVVVDHGVRIVARH